VLIEYPTLSEAQAAIKGADGTKLLDQTISVDFAFVRPPPQKGQAAAAAGRGGRGQGKGRARSKSPGEERRGGRDEERDEVE
jgi:RNA-binding protein 8A